MAFISDDLHAALGILALCDALEEKDDAKAHAYLMVARKHAHAIVARYGKDREGVNPGPDGTTPADVPEKDTA